MWRHLRRRAKNLGNKSAQLKPLTIQRTVVTYPTAHGILSKSKEKSRNFFPFLSLSFFLFLFLFPSLSLSFSFCYFYFIVGLWMSCYCRCLSLTFLKTSQLQFWLVIIPLKNRLSFFSLYLTHSLSNKFVFNTRLVVLLLFLADFFCQAAFHLVIISPSSPSLSLSFSSYNHRYGGNTCDRLLAEKKSKQLLQGKGPFK